MSNKAVALAWNISAEAPFIVANGKNALADRMLEIANDCGIKIVNDTVLCDILSDAEIGSCIPPATYEAVATIFAFLEKGLTEDWF